jgi:hypothetical protein
MPNNKGALTIADYPGDQVDIACSKCDRRGRYRKNILAERFDSDAVLPDVLARLSADCPRRTPHGNDPCGAFYPALIRQRPDSVRA